jgi:hypothetical protein
VCAERFQSRLRKSGDDCTYIYASLDAVDIPPSLCGLESGSGNVRRQGVMVTTVSCMEMRYEVSEKYHCSSNGTSSFQRYHI